MDNTFKVRYEFGWLWRRYLIEFTDTALILYSQHQEQRIQIAYRDIDYVWKTLLPLDGIFISFNNEILTKYTANQSNWFPPRPLLYPKVAMLNLYSFQRNKILDSFRSHGVNVPKKFIPRDWGAIMSKS